MATNFPGSLDSGTQQPSPSSTTDLDASGFEHDVVHTNHSGAIIALETKLGSTDSNPVADAVLMGTGSGTSAWDTSPTFKGAVTVGVDDTGHDVQFFGAAAGSHLLWDESENRLDVVASSGAAYIRSLNGTATTYIGSDSSNTGLFGTSSAHDIRFISNDTERMRISSAGNVMVGGTTQPGTDAVMYTEGVVSSYNPTTSTTGVLIKAYSDVGGTQSLIFDLRADGDITTRGKLAIKSGSYLAGYLYGASTSAGAGFNVVGSGGASIGFMGSPNNDDMHFQSTDTSGYFYLMVGNTYRCYSTNTGGWYPYVDNTYDLGWSSKRWDDVYATNGTIQTSDVNFKKDIADTTLGLDFINALRPVEYKWKEGSRKHQGFIAQEVKTVLDAKDVAADQAMWGLNTVKEGAKVIVPVTDEDGIPQKTEVDNEERQSLRYTELIAPLVKAIQELTTRVAALEG